MSTVKQKYLIDETGKIFSPVTHITSVYLNDNHIGSYMSSSYKNLVWWSQSYGILTLNETIPCAIINLVNGNYGRLSSNKWVCYKTGTYRVDAHCRLEDINGPIDRVLYINSYSSDGTLKTRRPFWYNQKNRGTVSGSVTIELDNTDYIGLCVWETSGAQVNVHSCGLYIYGG